MIHPAAHLNINTRTMVPCANAHDWVLRCSDAGADVAALDIPLHGRDRSKTCRSPWLANPVHHPRAASESVQRLAAPKQRLYTSCCMRPPGWEMMKVRCCVCAGRTWPALTSAFHALSFTACDAHCLSLWPTIISLHTHAREFWGIKGAARSVGDMQHEVTHACMNASMHPCMNASMHTTLCCAATCRCKFPNILTRRC
jgi:hypothetical protein